LEALLGGEPATKVRQVSEKNSQFQVFMAVHLQYWPDSSTPLLERNDETRTMVPLLWALFRTFCAENRRSALPTKLNDEALLQFLGGGDLKLPRGECERLVDAAFAKVGGRDKHLQFDGFQSALLDAMARLASPTMTYVASTLLPIAVKAASALDQRARAYQKESRRLATEEVRKLLQVNVGQLKIVYVYYALVAEKRKSPCPKKTITLEEMVLFAKDFSIVPELCTVRDLVEAFSDMSLRKPGPRSSLEHYVLPFNQWVQLLFHLALRFCLERGEAAAEAEGAHLQIVALLQRMDASGAKGRIKAKGIKPFICVVPDKSSRADRPGSEGVEGVEGASTSALPPTAAARQPAAVAAE